jgi:hypothetical protein
MTPLGHTHSHGWVLPSTLFGLALLLATVRVLSLDVSQITRLYGEIRVSESMHQRAVGGVASLTGDLSQCKEYTFSLNGEEIAYEVCGEREAPFMVFPPTANLPIPTVDYDAIFTQAVPCPTTPTSSASRDTDAPRASKDCPSPPTVTGSLITVENVIGESTRITSNSSKAAILASPGAIVLAGALIVETDLLIVAGGDISLSSITTSSSETRKVTIISALGAIRVGYVAPEISVMAAGRGVIEVPETKQMPPFPLPPQREYGVLGMWGGGE